MSLPVQHRLRHRRQFSLVYRKGLRRSSQHLTLRALRYEHLSEAVETTAQAIAPSNLHSQRDRAKLTSPSSGLQCGKHSARQLQGQQNVHYPRNASPANDNPAPTRFGVSISQKVSKKAVVRNRIKRQLKAAFRQLLPRISGNWLIVVVVRPSAVQCDYGQFLQELEQMLTRAEVINGHS